MTTIASNQNVQYIGIAITDKAENSRELMVYCPELLPFIQGSLTGANQTNEINTTSGSKSYKSQVTTTNAIKCIYRGGDANRLTPPDVRKGEQVVVWSYGDTNQFYWRDAGVDGNTRRTETYRIGVGDTLANNATLDDTNCHFIEIDSRRHNHIKLKTADSNGEAYCYTLTLSPETNKIMLGDNDGNSIVIDSTVPSITMCNKKGSILDLNDENIILACKKNITIESKAGQITMHSAKETTLKADKDIHAASGTNIEITAAQTFKEQSGSNFDIKSGAVLTLQSGGSLNINAGGGLSMTYTGSGSCVGSGGATMTMQMREFNINKG